MIKYSIVVPVYNVKDYLEICVLSLVNQSVTDIYEILVVDDGSTDGSSDICDSLQKRYSNVRVYHKKNGGLASARNEGLKHVKGEYVLFVDSDDYVDKDYISRIEQANKDYVDFIAFNYQKVNEKGLFMSGHSFAKGVYNLAGDHDRYHFLLSVFLRYGIGYEACNKVYSMKLISKYALRFHEEGNHFPEDKYFNLCYLCHCNKVKVIEDKIYYWLQRDSSISGTIRSGRINRLGLNITLCRLASSYYREYNNYLYERMPALFLSESVSVLHAMQWDDTLKDINQYLKNVKDIDFFNDMMLEVKKNCRYLDEVVASFNPNEQKEIQALLRYYLNRTNEQYTEYLKVIRPKPSIKRKLNSYFIFIRKTGFKRLVIKAIGRSFRKEDCR